MMKQRSSVVNHDVEGKLSLSSGIGEVATEKTTRGVHKSCGASISREIISDSAPLMRAAIIK